MTVKARRNSRAYSILSEDDTRATPPPPPTRRGCTRNVRAISITSDTPLPTEASQTTRIPPHYFLAPTVPSPFAGTLDASLDAILQWGRTHPATSTAMGVLLQPVSTGTNWPAILSTSFGSGSSLDPRLGRFLLEEFLFLVTRILLPEQITENRAAMARLYDWKKHLAIRLVLRYDMMRERCLGNGPVGKRDLSVASLPPTNVVKKPIDTPNDSDGSYERRHLLPNIISTLIAAPAGGYTTHGVRERMKHYITPLDAYLLLSDEEVKGWGDKMLIVRASQIVLQWQWLRQKNDTLEEMESDGWEELEGKADECEWIAEKRDVGLLKGGKSVGQGE